MLIGWLVAAAVVSIILASFSDWFFGGVLFHGKYRTHPEVWRNSGGGQGANPAVAWSALLGVLSCVAFIYLEVRLAALTWGRALGMAIGVWLLAPLPLLITNALFIKLHPLNTFANALAGW
jgi:hypothetical protein